jgi:ubiquinone/menaquinone biosynthesis C-methylase UbiE
LITDRDHLTGQVYSNQEPLAIRIATHRRYTVPPMDFIRWVLDLIPWRGDEWVLDVGCGNGAYATPIAERLTGAGRYLAGDLSLGMLRDLLDGWPQQCLTPVGSAVVNLDAVALPLPAESCDVILTNHLLYHVPEVNQALAECHRVVKEGGRLLAATDSQTSMAELTVLIRGGYDQLEVPFTSAQKNHVVQFSLENGREPLTRRFGQVERHLLHSALVFPEPAPLLAYIDSHRSLFEPGLPVDVSWEDLMRVWHKLIADHIARHGTFRIGKIVGAFVAVKRHPVEQDLSGPM